MRASVRAILEETCDVLEAANGAQALEVLKAHEVDLVMLDQRMPGEPGIDVLPRIKAADPSTVVVIATAVRELRTAVEALKRGAYDYLTKPFDVDDILMLAQRALDKRALEREVLYLRSALAGGPPDANGLAGSFERMVGRHPEMARIYQLITQIASTPTTVLITGESGTGKELVARAIHARSERRGQPFVAVNVAAIPETLVESELFGHEKGAFTGAHAKKLGRFELAHGGTVFLDEIGTLSMDLQAKLLRVLQEREIERLGGIRPVPVDVRILAATNVNLRSAVKARTFREDLYYRLNVVPIHLPPLRERREDIPALVEHFVRKIARECNRDVRGVSTGALEVLTRYDWPGNVRELENVLHRAVVLAREPGHPPARRAARRRDAGDRLAPRRGHRAAAARGDGAVRAPVHPARARGNRLEREPGGAAARRAPQHRAHQALGLGHPAPRCRRRKKSEPVAEASRCPKTPRSRPRPPSCSAP